MEQQNSTKQSATPAKKSTVKVTPKVSKPVSGSSASKVVIFTPDQLQKLGFAQQLQDAINKQIQPAVKTQNKRNPYKKRHPKLVKDKVAKPKILSGEERSTLMLKSVKSRFDAAVKFETNVLPDCVNSESSVGENVQSDKNVCDKLNMKKEDMPEIIKLKTSPWRRRKILKNNEPESCVAKVDIEADLLNKKEEVVRDLFNVKVKPSSEVAVQVVPEVANTQSNEIGEVRAGISEVLTMNDCEIEEVIIEEVGGKETEAILEDHSVKEVISDVLIMNDCVIEEIFEEVSEKEAEAVSKDYQLQNNLNKEEVERLKKERVDIQNHKSIHSSEIIKQLNEENVSLELVKPHQTRKQSIGAYETIEDIAKEVKEISEKEKNVAAEVVPSVKVNDTKIDDAEKKNILVKNKTEEVVTNQDIVEEVQKLNDKNQVSPTISNKRRPSIIEKEGFTTPEVAQVSHKSSKIDYAKVNENIKELQKSSEEETLVVPAIVQAKPISDKPKEENEKQLLKLQEKNQKKERLVAQNKEEAPVPEVSQSEPILTRRKSARKGDEKNSETKEESIEEIKYLNEEFVGHVKSPAKRRLSLRIDYAKNSEEVKKVENKEEMSGTGVAQSKPLLTRRQSMRKSETEEEPLEETQHLKIKSPSKRRLSIRIDYSKNNENVEGKKLNESILVDNASVPEVLQSKPLLTRRQSMRKSATEEEAQHLNLKSPSKRRLSTIRIDYAKGNENIEDSVIVENQEAAPVPGVARRQSVKKDKKKSGDTMEEELPNVDQSPSKRRQSVRIDYAKNNAYIKKNEEANKSSKEEKKVAQNKKQNVLPNNEKAAPKLAKSKQNQNTIPNVIQLKSTSKRRQNSRTDDIKKIDDKKNEIVIEKKADQNEVVQLKPRRQSIRMFEKEKGEVEQRNEERNVSPVNQNRRSLNEKKDIVGAALKKRPSTRLSYIDDEENEKDAGAPEIIRLKPQLKSRRNARIHETQNDDTKQDKEEGANPNTSQSTTSNAKENVVEEPKQSNEIASPLKSQQKRQSTRFVDVKSTDAVLGVLELTPSRKTRKSIKIDEPESCKIEKIVTEQPQHGKKEVFAESCSIEENQTLILSEKIAAIEENTTKIIQIVQPQHEDVAESCSIEENQAEKKSIQIVANEVVFFSPSEIQKLTKNPSCKPIVLAANPALVVLRKPVNLQGNQSESENLNEEEGELIVKEEKMPPKCYTRKKKTNVDPSLSLQSNKKGDEVNAAIVANSTHNDGDSIKMQEEKREFVNSKNVLPKIVKDPIGTPKSKSPKKSEILNQADKSKQICSTQTKSGRKRKLETTVESEENLLVKTDTVKDVSLTIEATKLDNNTEILQRTSKRRGGPRKSALISKPEEVETATLESEADLPVKPDALQDDALSSDTTKLADNIEILHKSPRTGNPRKSTRISKTKAAETTISSVESNRTIGEAESHLSVETDILDNSESLPKPPRKTGISRKLTRISKSEVVENTPETTISSGKCEENVHVNTEEEKADSLYSETPKLADNTEILQKTRRKVGRPKKSTGISKTKMVKILETSPETPISAGRSNRKRKLVDYSKLSKAGETEGDSDEEVVLKKPKRRKKADGVVLEIDVKITPNPQTDEVDCSYNQVKKHGRYGDTKNSKLFYSLVNEAKLFDTCEVVNKESASSENVNVDVQAKQGTKKANGNIATCDVCKLEMDKKSWPHHKLKKHNNLAWKVGEKPLDLNDTKFVLAVLNDMYKKKKNYYYCDKCENVSRSVQGYLSHRSRCQRSTQDVMALQVTCEHCKRVMLPVSMYTHLKYCRGLRPNDEDQDLEDIAREDSPLPKKRKAAERASKFITALKEDDDNPKERHYKSKKWIKNYNFEVAPWAKKIILQQCREKGSAKCCFQGCDYENPEWSEIFSHFKECTKKTEGFSCRLCLATFEAKPDIFEHLKNNHVDEFKTDVNLDESDSYDDDEGDDEGICKKQKDNKGSANFTPFKPSFQLKFSGELTAITMSKPIVFPSAWKWTFDFCSEHFSNVDLFSNWRNSSLQNLDLNKIGAYLPKQKYSVCTSIIKCQKYIDPLANDYNWKRFMLFESSRSDTGISSIFCGGAVSAMAWIPTPYETLTCEQILAVAVQPDLEIEYKVNQFYSDPGIIQFWNCGSFKSAPKLQFCLAHDYNPIWCLEWCPSGCYDVKAKENESKRLGILAVGSGNSNVYLYSVCEPPATSGKIIKMKPIKKLSLIMNTEKVTATLKPHVSKISWTKASGHQHIAVGYSNGMIALYNLHNLSDLLKFKGEDELETQQPYLTINAHVHSVTALTLSHISDGCRWLMSASADRTIKYWDLREPTTPITSTSKFVVTDGVWLTHWLCSILCFDDSCNTGITQTSLHQVRNFKSESCNVMHSNSAIQCINSCDWTNGLIQGNVAGEIQAFFPHQLLHGMDNCSKYFKKKKAILSYCRLVEKNVSIEERLEKENEKLKLMAGKPLEVVDVSQITSNPNRFKPEPLTYKGAANKYGVVFCDYQLSKLEEFVTNFNDYTTSHREKYYPTRPNLYPMQNITKVQFNPNRGSFNYFAAGYQIGFVRIFPMQFITSK